MENLTPPVAAVWPEWCYENSGKERETQDSIINNNNKDAINKNVNSLTSKYPNGNTWASTRGRTTPSGATIPLSSAQNERPLTKESTNSSTTHGNRRKDHVHRDVWRRSPPKRGHLIGNSPTNISSLITPSPTYTSTVPVLNSSYSKMTSSTSLGPPLSSTLTRSTSSALGAIGGFPANGVELKPAEYLASRNCSDLIRSLAAKYNNNSYNFNGTRYGLDDYFGSFNERFSRSLLPRICLFRSQSGAPVNLNSTYNLPSLYPQVDHRKELSVTPQTTCASLAIPSSAVHPGYPQNGLAPSRPFPLIDFTSTHMIFDMVRNVSKAQTSTLETYLKGETKRPAESPPSPLDLSYSVATKRQKKSVSRMKGSNPEDEKEKSVSVPTSSPTPKAVTTPSPGNNTDKVSIGVSCGDRECPSLASVLRWTVEDVCEFVQSVDLCAEYVEAFREHRIDGSSLLLLTEDHLTTSIQMKLGPALKLRSVLARKLGSCGVCLHCIHCHASISTSTPGNDQRLNSIASGQ